MVLQELDSDIQEVTHAGKHGEGDQRGYVASANDGVDQQLAALGEPPQHTCREVMERFLRPCETHLQGKRVHVSIIEHAHLLQL